MKIKVMKRPEKKIHRREFLEKEFTRMVMVKSLEHGEAVVEVASTRTVEPSVNIDDVTKSEEAVPEGP